MLILPLDLRLTETNFSSLQVQVNASVTFCYSVLPASHYGVVLESPVSSQMKTSCNDESNISLRSMPPDGPSALASASILTDAKT